MKRPNFFEEIKLNKQGYNFVAGLDEAGRGPLAGPVVAAAVCFEFSLFNHPSLRGPRILRGTKQSYNISTVHGRIDNGWIRTGLLRPAPQLRGGARNDFTLRDSKKLSPRQREEWYEILTADKNIKWGVGVVSRKIIDEINILEATKLAMKKALENLKAEPDFLLLDGNFLLEDLNISQKAIISGDEKIVSIAAASIIAKVTRDRLMRQYDKKFPVYGFTQHKGYGTKKHFAALRLHGPCPLHRFSFKPVRKLVND